MTELSGTHMSALGAAMARARHLVVEGEPKILRDQFAQPLLGLSDEEVISRTALLGDTPYGAALWAMRSRFAEDKLAVAIERGVGQYVVLGAGLDSFALRNPNATVTIFEVDDRPLQRWKLDRLDELGISVPNCLRFVPCDFESMSIAAALADAGFQEDKPAVVSWLGVTQYLTKSAVWETVAWAASLARGSQIVLTYVVPGEEAEAWKAHLAASGARFATFYTPEEIESVLLSAGFADVELVTPEEAQRLFFDARSDGLVAPQIERLAVGTSV